MRALVVFLTLSYSIHGLGGVEEDKCNRTGLARFSWHTSDSPGSGFSFSSHSRWKKLSESDRRTLTGDYRALQRFLAGDLDPDNIVNAIDFFYRERSTGIHHPASGELKFRLLQKLREIGDDGKAPGHQDIQILFAMPLSEEVGTHNLRSKYPNEATGPEDVDKGSALAAFISIEMSLLESWAKNPESASHKEAVARLIQMSESYSPGEDKVPPRLLVSAFQAYLKLPRNQQDPTYRGRIQGFFRMFGIDPNSERFTTIRGAP